jgi:hypothetical protein
VRERGYLFLHALLAFVARCEEDGGREFEGEGGFADALRAVEQKRARQTALVELGEDGRPGGVMANGAVPFFGQRQAGKRVWIGHAGIPL